MAANNLKQGSSHAAEMATTLSHFHVTVYGKTRRSSLVFHLILITLLLKQLFGGAIIIFINYVTKHKKPSISA